MKSVEILAPNIGVKKACSVLDVSRATIYRWRKPRSKNRKQTKKRRSPIALTRNERQEVLDLLHSPDYVDMAPQQIYANLLDNKQRYLCSIRTMYRLLHQEDEVRERRNQRKHPIYEKPELLATDTNQLWSWDITLLKGPKKGNTYKLYVVLDVFSRYVIAWALDHREDGGLAKEMIDQACRQHGIEKEQLTIHADNGAAMTSKPVSELMTDLGVARSHSRPSVSNDNPYSESQFKTLKYRPAFPKRFLSIQDARAHCREFFTWYNTEHHHSGIALLTPQQVHFGQAEAILAERNRLLAATHEGNPRFKGKKPKFFHLPTAVWINPPKDQTYM